MPRYRDELVTLFFEEPFMQAIQTNCPWLLRYLVTAIILTKVRRSIVMVIIVIVLANDTRDTYSPHQFPSFFKRSPPFLSSPVGRALGSFCFGICNTPRIFRRGLL